MKEADQMDHTQLPDGTWLRIPVLLPAAEPLAQQAPQEQP